MLLRNIAPGMYYPGQSLLHRLQARTKLFVMLWLIVLLMVARQHRWQLVPFLVVSLLIFGGCLLSGIAPGELWRRTRLLIGLTLISTILSLLFFSAGGGEQTIFSLGPLLLPYHLLRPILSGVGCVLLFLLFCPRLPPFRNLWRNRQLLRSVIITFFVFLSCFLLFTWQFPASQALTLGPILLTSDTTWWVVVAALLLLLFYVLSLLITMTTLPIALIEGLSMLLAPLRKLRLPVDDFALMALLALRFFPTLFDEAEQLLKAQLARGADFSHGSVGERVRSLGTFFVLLVRGALRRASELATALEARGYQAQGQQTRLHETSLTWLDYLVLLLIVLATLPTLFIR